MAAQRDDPAVAERLLTGPQRRWTPPVAEWSLDRELAASINDRLDIVIARLGDLPVAPGLKRRSKLPKPYPRPLTALERARAAARQAEANSLMDTVEAARARWRTDQQRKED